MLLNRLFKKILLIALISLLSSCGIFSPLDQPQIHNYQITSGIDTSKIFCNKNNLPILQVLQMQANSPFNTEKMLYTSSKYELGYYSYSKWATLPQKMLTTAIVDKILQSCLYSNVISEDTITTYQYQLSSQLLNLKQTINGSTSHVDLSIMFQLISNNSNQIIKSKTLSASTSASANPNGFVDATNLATQTILNNLIEWLR
ncbi:MAG TPA: ABC-type transport auxiliary lipoprotein family protein [Burkholderiales bacterium]|nr:ABC-type transport auxiliary lipoprotein family protein [Burkholderiales bacterium]